MPGSQVNRGPDRRMLRRILALCVLFGLLAFPALILRLYRLQITDHEYYEALAIGQQLREAPTSPIPTPSASAAARRAASRCCISSTAASPAKTSK